MASPAWITTCYLSKVPVILHCDAAAFITDIIIIIVTTHRSALHLINFFNLLQYSEALATMGPLWLLECKDIWKAETHIPHMSVVQIWDRTKNFESAGLIEILVLVKKSCLHPVNDFKVSRGKHAWHVYFCLSLCLSALQP